MQHGREDVVATKEDPPSELLLPHLGDGQEEKHAQF